MNNNFNAQRHSDRIIKVCGMADPANIQSVALLTPMLMGFIFYEKSPRYAGALDPEVVKALPSYIHPVALFVNADEATVEATAEKFGIKILQLHGSESPEMCKTLRDKGFTIIKAFGLSDNPDWEAIRPYEEVADMFVFDTLTPSHGGSGQKFNWQELDSYPLSTPYLLGGGIGPDDKEAILAAMRPKMAGVDINSRFESAPGVKDIKLLTHFILSLRAYNED